MIAYQLTELKASLVRNEVALNLEEGDLICKNLYAGLNRRDHWITQGLYPGIELPCILGSDGLVEYEGVKYVMNPNENWGDRLDIPSSKYTIRGLQKQGTFASESAVQSKKLFKKPSHLSDAEAAILPLGGLTAYRALVSNCKVQAGDRVLINGIGGGVALLAFQFAIALGAEVYVSSSSPSKMEKAIALGAKDAINYRDEQWGKSFKKKVGGFDVIIDSAGGEGFIDLIHASNMGARIGIFGGTRGYINKLSPQHLFFKQIHIFGSTMGNDQEFADMIDLVDKYEIKPIVDTVYSFDEVNEAMQRMLSPEKFGKVAIKIS